jgi:hypothetical protein
MDALLLVERIHPVQVHAVRVGPEGVVAAHATIIYGRLGTSHSTAPALSQIRPGRCLHAQTNQEETP